MATPHQKTGAKERRKDLSLRALKMRLGGASYRAIGAALELNQQTAYNYVQVELDALDKLKGETAEQLRTVELERCDALQLSLWQQAMAGDQKAVSTILSVMDRRARLLGLDKPNEIGGDLIVKVIYGDQGGDGTATAAAPTPAEGAQ